MSNSNGNNHVSWTALAIVVSVIITLFGYLVFGQGKLSDKIDETNASVSDLKGTVVGVQKDVSWLREALGKGATTQLYQGGYFSLK